MSEKNFDFIVLGAGAAGLSAVDFACRLDVKVLLIEKEKIGGDCTWTGCIPSKSLLHCAHTYQNVINEVERGLFSGKINVNFSDVKDYVQNRINIIATTESPDILRKEGIKVIFGEARFISRNQIEVNGEIYTGKYFLVCTGAKPIIPPIKGLENVPYFTYENIFDINDLPEHLIIIGGGPIGCEMAQAFRRLGSNVTIIEGLSHLLPRDDLEASELIEEIFQKEGIEIIHNDLVTKVSPIEKTEEVMVLTEKYLKIIGTHILVAVGRKPNTNRLQLDRAGVELNPNMGIIVNKSLRTSQKHIYAAGDCVGGLQFTHLAGFQGVIATRNALLPGNAKGIPNTVPWTTFTQPEVAHVGISDPKQYKNPNEVVTCVWPLIKVDRAITDSQTDGFIKIFHTKDGDILGVTIVAPRAGELITEWVIAMDNSIKLGAISSSLHVYPTYSLAAMQVAAAIRLNQFLSGTIGKLIVSVSRFFR